MSSTDKNKTTSIDAVIQRVKRDKACGYLDISTTFFKRFIIDYNSSSYGQATIAFAHLYKAWDALYQSMILLTGQKVRKEHPEHLMGYVTGLTEDFLKKIEDGEFDYNKVEASKWEIPEFKEIADAVIDPSKNPYKNKLLNSLDFLRKLRNSAEHDFLEVGGGSYNSLVLRTNPYVIPICKVYLRIYEVYREKVLIACATPQTNPKLGHNNGRATTCAKKQVQKTTLADLEQILHFPLPVSLVDAEIQEIPASVTTLVKLLLKGFAKYDKHLLQDENWHVESVKDIMTEEYLNETFPYRSLKEIGDKLGVDREKIEKEMRKHKMKQNQSYVLHLQGENQIITTIYSTKLVEELTRLLVS